MIEPSAYTLNIHAIPMLLVGIVTFWLGTLVYRSNRQSAAHLHFLILCGSIAIWLIATSIGLCARVPETALVWYTLDNVGVMYISVAFYAFSAEFLRLNRPWSIRLGYGLSTLLAIMVMTHHEFITGVRHYWWGYFPQWGLLSIPFFIMFFAYMAAAFAGYIRAYRLTTTPIRRQQIKFVLGAFVIAYLGSVDFLPAFGLEIYPFGYIPIFLLTVVVTIAILRHQLLDAALVLSMSAIYLPLIPFALLLMFFAQILQDMSPTTFAGILVLTTVAFTILHIAFQSRLQSTLNKMLFPDRHDAYTTLTRFSHAMVTNPDLANLQTEIVHTLQTVMGIENVSVFLFDKEQGCYALKTSSKIDEDRTSTVRLTSHDFFAMRLLQHDRPIVKEELQHGLLGWERTETLAFVETLTDMHAEVCIPLVNKARLIGFVNLGHKPSQRFYSQDEIKLLTSLANNAAIALDNAMLYEDWKRSQLLVRRADRLRSMETLAGGFAHEVRNPLTSIKTFIQLAPSRRNDPEFMDAFSAVVSDDLSSIERLIEEILDYTRYMKPKFSLTSINEIVKSNLHLIDVKATALGITIEKRLAKQLAPIMADRQQIKQVLINLALNAIDAMREQGGRLTVSTRQVTRLDDTRWVQIRVSDTGCGIAPTDLPHVFDPFFTTKHDSTERVGTGLGLSIVHQIIQEHAGTIDVRSVVGKGSTFIVTLPEKMVLSAVSA